MKSPLRERWARPKSYSIVLAGAVWLEVP